MADTTETQTPPRTSIAEEAVSIPAGPITFMVEHRQLDSGGGPSIRVLGSDDHHEYLRFDCFDVDPHYHYEPPGSDAHAGTDRRVMLDTDAEGEPIAWTIDKLRHRLGRMLTAADAQRLAAQLDDATLQRAVDEVQALVT